MAVRSRSLVPPWLLRFLAGSVVGALVGTAWGMWLTRRWLAEGRAENPAYTAEGLQYVPAAGAYLGAAVGAAIAVLIGSALRRRIRRHQTTAR